MLYARVCAIPYYTVLYARQHSVDTLRCGQACVRACACACLEKGAMHTRAWKGTLGTASRISTRRSHGHSRRKRSATSKVAPPQFSSE